jgi:hypothetical protein
MTPVFLIGLLLVCVFLFIWSGLLLYNRVSSALVSSPFCSGLLSFGANLRLLVCAADLRFSDDFLGLPLTFCFSLGTSYCVPLILC